MVRRSVVWSGSVSVSVSVSVPGSVPGSGTRLVLVWSRRPVSSSLRSGPVRSGRSGPVRSGPVRSGPVRSGPVRSGPVGPVGPVRSGPVRSGPVVRSSPSVFVRLRPSTCTTPSLSLSLFLSLTRRAQKEWFSPECINKRGRVGAHYVFWFCVFLWLRGWWGVSAERAFTNGSHKEHLRPRDKHCTRANPRAAEEPQQRVSLLHQSLLRCSACRKVSASAESDTRSSWVLHRPNRMWATPSVRCCSRPAQASLPYVSRTVQPYHIVLFAPSLPHQLQHLALTHFRCNVLRAGIAH